MLGSGCSVDVSGFGSSTGAESCGFYPYADCPCLSVLTRVSPKAFTCRRRRNFPRRLLPSSHLQHPVARRLPSAAVYLQRRAAYIACPSQRMPVDVLHGTRTALMSGLQCILSLIEASCTLPCAQREQCPLSSITSQSGRPGLPRCEGDFLVASCLPRHALPHPFSGDSSWRAGTILDGDGVLPASACPWRCVNNTVRINVEGDLNLRNSRAGPGQCRTVRKGRAAFWAAISRSPW